MTDSSIPDNQPLDPYLAFLKVRPAHHGIADALDQRMLTSPRLRRLVRT